MKKIKLIIVFIIFFSNNLLSSIEGQIILKVENKIITSFQLKNKVLSSLLLNNQNINQINIDNLKSQTIDALILVKLKEIEIEKYNLERKEGDLAMRMNDYLNKISSNNIPNIKNVFKNNGVDFDMFKAEIETEFLWQNLIYMIYSNKINIDEQAINLEIENLIKEKQSIEEFKLSEIEILLNNDENDKKKILSVENDIKKFGFENTVLKFSASLSAENKGDLGWVNAKSLSSEIYSIIAEMEIGDYSSPIMRANSAIFLMVKDKKISKTNQLNKSELKAQVVSQRKNELFNLYSQSHLSKLKNTSLIEY
jgi:peptidyl-prolyl cis-trans isomerase SurA